MKAFEAFRTVFLLGILQGLFLSIALFRQGFHSRANSYLAWWMLCLAYFLGCSWAYLGGLIPDGVAYFSFIEFDLFLMGPLLLLYVLASLDAAWRPARGYALLFIPPAASLGLLVLTRIFGPGAFRAYYEAGFLSFVSAIAYLSLSLAAVFKRREDFLDWMFARQRKIWVGSILALHGLGWILSLLRIILLAFFPLAAEADKALLAVIALEISAEILLLGYFALAHPVIFAQRAIEAAEAKPVPPLRGIDTAEEYGRILGLAERKIYRDPDLTLDAFARKAGIFPSARVSQILSKHEGRSFLDFLNEHRFREFLALLARSDKRGVTVLELCYEAGFNSKATFYRVFKERTGISPVEYRERLLEEKDSGVSKNP